MLSTNRPALRLEDYRPQAERYAEQLLLSSMPPSMQSQIDVASSSNPSNDRAAAAVVARGPSYIRVLPWEIMRLVRQYVPVIDVPIANTQFQRNMEIVRLIYERLHGRSLLPLKLEKFIQIDLDDQSVSALVRLGAETPHHLGHGPVEVRLNRSQRGPLSVDGIRRLQVLCEEMGVGEATSTLRLDRPDQMDDLPWDCLRPVTLEVHFGTFEGGALLEHLRSEQVRLQHLQVYAQHVGSDVEAFWRACLVDDPQLESLSLCQTVQPQLLIYPLISAVGGGVVAPRRQLRSLKLDLTGWTPHPEFATVSPPQPPPLDICRRFWDRMRANVFRALGTRQPRGSVSDPLRTHTHMDAGGLGGLPEQPVVDPTVHATLGCRLHTDQKHRGRLVHTHICPALFTGRHAS